MIREWQSSGIVTEEYRSADMYSRVPPLLSRSERRKLARGRRPGVRVPAKRTVVGSLMLAGCSVEFRHLDEAPPIWEWACRRCGGRVLVVDSSHALPSPRQSGTSRARYGAFWRARIARADFSS